MVGGHLLNPPTVALFLWEMPNYRCYKGDPACLLEKVFKASGPKSEGKKEWKNNIGFAPPPPEK